jgi:hypothetical protein
VGRLGDRARRPEWQEIGDRLEKERTLHEAISRLSATELRAMHEDFKSADRDEWTEEDKPLMLRLLAIREEVRREEAGEVPWLSEIKGEE